MSPIKPVLMLLAALALAAPVVAQPRTAAPAAPATANKLVPIARAFPFLDRFYGVPAAERSLFRLGYRLRMNDQVFRGRAWYVDPAGRRTAARVGAVGDIQPLPTLQMLQGRGWRLEVEAPESARMAINMEIEPTARPAAEMSAVELARSVTQVNGAVRRAAGMMRFAAPTMTRVVFTGVRTGEAVLADGRTVPLPVADGGPNFTPADLPTARTLRFGAAPTRLSIGPAARNTRRR